MGALHLKYFIATYHHSTWVPVDTFFRQKSKCRSTMLRFHGFTEPTMLARDELVGGRRLSSDGVLSGALHSLGYYSTDVCLGSPPRKYDLIVDTGSSLTAVPCSTCARCGEHVCGRAGRFDPALSKTAKPVECSAPARESGVTLTCFRHMSPLLFLSCLFPPCVTRRFLHQRASE